MSKLISDYYALAELVNYDINIVALLIQTARLQPQSKIVTDLEDLKLTKYESEIDMALSLRTGTLKDLKDLFSSASLDFGIRTIEKTVTTKTNLLSFMEG